MILCPNCKVKVKEVKVSGQNIYHCKKCNWMGPYKDVIFIPPPRK